MKEKKRANQIVLLQNLSDRLVWLEVKKEGEALNILGGGVEPFFEENGDQTIPLPTETPLDRLKTAVERIKQQVKGGWFANREVVYLAPSHRLTARFLETPPASDDSIRDLVAFEVSEALQVPISEIAWDMHLSSAHEDSPEKDILWIATRKEYIDGIRQAWPEGQLEPDQMTADFWGVYEFLLAADPDILTQPAILVSQEGNRATISIATRKAIYFTRSVTLSRTVHKTAQPLAPDSNQERQLALEIQRTLTYVSEQFPAGSIQEMYICGFENWDDAQLNAMGEHFGSRIHRLTVEDTKSFLAGDIETVAPDHLSVLCTVYCQLMKGIAGPTLIEEPEEGFTLQSMIPEAAIPSQKFMAAAGVLLAAFLVLWIGQTLWYRSALDSRLARSQELLQLADQLKKEETALKALNRTNLDYADLMLFLAQKETLPQNVLVKSLVLDNKSGVDLVLVGGNHKMMTDLVDSLNDSKFFRNITESRAVNEKDGFTMYLHGQLNVAQ
jgi:hypothetical protein